GWIDQSLIKVGVRSDEKASVIHKITVAKMSTARISISIISAVMTCCSLLPTLATALSFYVWKCGLR
ncbi:MAG: hypothetical protein ACU837_14270, partial [Gammaproteobacteria bacterium]